MGEDAQEILALAERLVGAIPGDVLDRIPEADRVILEEAALEAARTLGSDLLGIGISPQSSRAMNAVLENLAGTAAQEGLKAIAGAVSDILSAVTGKLDALLKR